MGQSLAPSGNYNTLNVFNGGTKSTRAMIAPKGFQPWATYDTTGFIWLDTTNHFLYYHNGTSRVQIGAGGGGSGTVTNVSTGFGMLGGPITTTGTVRVDSNVMMTLARGYKVSDSVAGLIPSVSGYQLYTDTNTFDATKANLNAGLAGKQNYTDTSTWDATRSWVTGQIPSLTGYVPYTGATNNVNLGNYSITAANGVINHPSGSGVALSVTKGGNGEAVTVTKMSGSGNAMSVSGGVTLLSELHTTTAIADAYIASAATWNAKATTAALTDSVSGRQKYSDTAVWDATQAWVNSRGFGTGTVTSVGSGFGLTGGAITTTGTLRVDTTNVPTQYRVDTTAFNALTRINTKGSGTVTSIQVVGGTGATVTPTTAVTTSGVYTVTPEVSSATYNTLSNKRWVPRVISAASYTTSVTIPADSVDLFQITAQAGALLFNAPSGTPNNGDLLVIRIKDNGTARALTYNAIFNWSPPSTTVLGKYLVMCFMYNSVTSNWNFMWKRDEP